MEPEFAQPTRATRIKGGLMIAFAVVVWLFADRFYASVVTPGFEGPLCRTYLWTQKMVAIHLIFFFLVSLVCVRAAWKIHSSGQSPFPGAWLVVRRKIRRGWRAKAEAIGMAAVAVAIWAVMIWLVPMLRVIFCFEGGCPPPC